MAEQEVKLRITSDATSAIQGMNRVAASTRMLESVTASASGHIKSYWTGIAGAFSAGAIVYAMKSALTAMDEVAKTSQRIGVSAETLQAFGYAAKLSGLEMDGITTSLGRFSRNVVEAAQGTGAQAAVFKALNISVKDASGTLKSTDALIGEVADRFSAMKDSAGKTGIAMELFGRSGMQMIPFLNEGSKGLAEMRKEAEDLGLIMDTKSIKAAERLKDNFERLEMSFKGVVIRILSGAVPAFNQLAEAMLGVKKNEDALKSIGENLGTGLKAIASVAIGVVATIDLLIESLKELYDTAKNFGNIKVQTRSTGEAFGEAKSNVTEWFKNPSTFFTGVPPREQMPPPSVSRQQKTLQDRINFYGEAINRLWEQPAARLTKPPRAGEAPDILDTDKAKKALESFEKARDDFMRSVDEMDPALSALDKEFFKFDARMWDLVHTAREVKQPIQDIIDAWVQGREYLSAADLDKRNAEITEAWGKAFLEFRSIQEEITNKELSEIERRMAAEDLWARNITEKLGANWTPELGGRITKVSEASKGEIRRSAAREELEADTRRQLAAVQVAGEQYLMSREEVTTKTIALNQRLLSQYNEDLAVTTDAAAKLTLNDKIADLNLELMRSTYLLKELKGTFGEGWERGVAGYQNTMETAFQAGEAVAKRTAESMESAFIDFLDATSQGFLDWEKLVKSVLGDIQRELLRTLVVKPLVSGITGGGTNLLGSAVGLLGSIFGGGGTGMAPGYDIGSAYSYMDAGRASGGPISAGRPYIVGEAGPELIIPTAPATVIPNGQFGNTLSISVPVSIGPEHKALAAQIQQNVEREVRRTIREAS